MIMEYPDELKLVIIKSIPYMEGFIEKDAKNEIS